MRDHKKFKSLPNTRPRLGSFRNGGLIQAPLGCLTVLRFDRFRQQHKQFLEYLFQKWVMRATGGEKGFLQHLYNVKSAAIHQQYVENVFNISPPITFSQKNIPGISNSLANAGMHNRILRFVYHTIQKLAGGARRLGSNRFFPHVSSNVFEGREKTALEKIFSTPGAIFLPLGKENQSKENKGIKPDETIRGGGQSILHKESHSSVSYLQKSPPGSEMFLFPRTMRRSMLGDGQPSREHLGIGSRCILWLKRGLFHLLHIPQDFRT